MVGFLAKGISYNGKMCGDSNTGVRKVEIRGLENIVLKYIWINVGFKPRNSS